MLKNGGSRVRNQIQWARFYLVKGGYLDSSKRGVWSLTTKGAEQPLSTFDAMQTFASVQKTFSQGKPAKEQGQSVLIEG